MSTDFIALFDINIGGVTPEWLLARVEERPAAFESFVERYGHTFRTKRWTIEPPYPPLEAPSLYGPGGFALRVHGRTLEMWHGIRFSMFTGDAWHRETLRRISRAIAELVGSERVIYTHELAPYGDDDGLACIEAGLRSRIGPPATTFEELHASEYFGPRSWYIETFSDVGRTYANGGQQ
ncbi:MAG TPA: hypothetical protein VF310_03040 [Vicinamibacteria bacterium]